ncbi:MAG: hypothetical protein U0L23_07755 [Lachnospiraceae bacterium]|nr:hypothetical protein [Lachnospiraceae bacterium]
MKTKRIMVLMVCMMLLASSATVYAASGTFNSTDGNYTVHQYVDFLQGTSVLPDKYWGSAQIYGEDAGSASVPVKGWTEKKTIIQTTLNATKMSVEKSGFNCGYGQTWGKIRSTIDGVDKMTMQADL